MKMPTEHTLPGSRSDRPLTPAERRRGIVAASLGNGLEMYDFITYSFFAIQIGETFFPSENHYLSLMASLATFGAGFVTRPLGAAVLGTYADRAGRKPAMVLSMALMGLGIAMLVLTPGYASIGYAAPLIAILARMVQGFALGGEVGSATVYLMEGVEPLKRGFALGWQPASQIIAASIGSLIGLLLSLVMTNAQLASYGWRIAIAVGLLVVPVALFIRKNLPETMHHSEPDETPDEGFASYRRPIICGLIVMGSGTIGTYIAQYMATYGQNTLHLSPSVSLGASFLRYFVAFFSVLVGGVLTDRFGRKPLMLIPHALFCLLIIPSYEWITAAPDASSFIMGITLPAFIDGFIAAAVYAAMIESIPKRVRARAFALVYALPVTILGGTTQLMVTWLLKITGDPMALGWYSLAVALIGLAGMAGFKESAPIRQVRLRPAMA